MGAELGRRKFRLGFATRVTSVFFLIMLLAEIATLAIVNAAVDHSVHQQLGGRLEVGERVWRNFLANRDDRIAESVSVLAADFGFREALATGDAPTTLSALANHSRRIDADIAMLLAPDGSVRTGYPEIPREAAAAATAPLLEKARGQGRAVRVVVVEGASYQLALVPVMAPRLIGWVAMGRGFDREVADQFKSITGLDVAFVGRDLARPVTATTLAPAPALALSGHLADPAVAAAGSQYYTRRFGANGNRQDALQVVLLADSTAVMAPYVEMKRRVLVLAVLAVAALLLPVMLVGRRVGRPVEQLALAARRIGRGDYAGQLPVRGNDEISDLANAFNQMQAGIAERESRIVHQATHDGLTDLPNRAFALQALEAAISAARASGERCGVLMIDLDRFKEINDTLGHAFGDEVLGMVAQRLRGAVRSDDVLARLGGDEFLLVLEGADIDASVQRAASLVSALHVPFVTPRTQVTLDTSVGVAVFPDHAPDGASLLRRADIAMYEAKQQRSRVAVYRRGRDEEHLRRISLMGDLRRAVAGGELQLAFQPKVDLASGRVLHVEALSRWRHPVLGDIAPDEFIPLAEQSGTIHELTWYVMDESMRQAAPWILAERIRALAINLSPQELLHAGLVEFVRDCLARHGLAPENLILEVTESTVMRDLATSLATMHRLSALGVRLSIDDFGTGHSSLAQLRSLPVHEIKIDKSFIATLGGEHDDAVIVRSAIEIGHNMGLTVIAEGVEERGSLAVLRELDCDMVQGYFFSRPLPAADFATWHDRFTAECQVGIGEPALGMAVAS